MKTITEKKLYLPKLFTPRSGFWIFLAGLFTLFAPYLYLWSFVAIPSISIPMLILGAISFPAQKIFILLAMIHTLSAFILKASRKTKLISFFFSVVLIAGFFVSTGEKSNFRNGNPAFLFGAQTRLIWAGGSEIVKADALALLTQQLDGDGYTTSELQSSSLKKMGVGIAKVDKEFQSVAIFIRAGNFMYDFDEWGYIFTYERAPNVDFLKIESGMVINYWKLADGVYFFNRQW